MKEQDLLRRTTGKLRLPAANQTRQQNTPTQATKPNRPATRAAAATAATPWLSHIQLRAGLAKRMGSLLSR